MGLLELSRAEFLDGYFAYRPGEHLAVIEPTGGGKSWLCYQLLQQAMRQNPDLAVLVTMPKPADATAAAWGPTLGLAETPVWPPVRKMFAGRPPGHIVWPPHDMSLPPEQRRERIGDVLRRSVDDAYRKGRTITFVDDAHSAATMMGLNSYIEETLVNGRSNKAAMWVALQKPSGSAATGSVSSFVYSSTRHLFLGRDDEDRNVQRFGEIGAFDAKETQQIVRNLRLYRIDGETVSQKLYIDKRGPYRCLVGP
jgi:hypothetical protein